MIIETKPTLAALRAALEKSWGADTARGPWYPEIPTLNQCVPTALVVQDWLGGVIRRCKTQEGDSHYWNLLPSGEVIDLTADQFLSITDKPLHYTETERTLEYILSNPDTLRRYQLLAERVRMHLKE